MNIHPLLPHSLWGDRDRGGNRCHRPAAAATAAAAAAATAATEATVFTMQKNILLTSYFETSYILHIKNCENSVALASQIHPG